MPGVRDRYDQTANQRAANDDRGRLARMTVQVDCACRLAAWLRTLGHELPPFSWSYER